MSAARSWLYAPGASEKLLGKVFDVGADEVILDLEDAVPPLLKQRARTLVAELLASARAWVRCNRAGSPECAADLEAVGGLAAGLRIPKVESAADVAWVRERAPGAALVATIESAHGVAAVHAIATAPGVRGLCIGTADLAADLGAARDVEALLFSRSAIVVAARAAGLEATIDGAFPDVRDVEGLAAECRAARRLGFTGKSAIHPAQVPVINEAFSPTAEEIAESQAILSAYESSHGEATRLDSGYMIDVATVRRARRVVDAAGSR